MLIEKGADMNIKDNYGFTAFHYALKIKDNLDRIKLLIEKGADMNI